MSASPSKFPDEVRASFWNHWMDGDSPAEIAAHSWSDFHAAGLVDREASSSEVRKVLSEDPPESVKSDLRYVHGVRAFWIAATGVLDECGTDVRGLVIAFQPYRLAAKAFQKGVRSICREFRSMAPRGVIQPHVIEGVEMDAALRLLHSGRTVGWIIDGEGNTRRYMDDFANAPATDAPVPNP
jgi:hypothetical protein